MIEKALVLSTCHVHPGQMNGDTLNTGGLRSFSHEYGWVIFVYPKCPNVPEWLRAIHSRAVKKHCTMILFDRDANSSKKFRSYDW